MATGAGDLYWERQGLPRVFKHDLLGRYLPKFGGKTGSKSARVVYLDGYAAAVGTTTGPWFGQTYSPDRRRSASPGNHLSLLFPRDRFTVLR